MNANELAEIIEHLENARYIGASKAAEMLRQQQAEIEALKAGKIKAYDNGYEDGRKPNTHPVKEQGNPVAWRSQDPDGYWSVYQSPVEGAEPLYTGFKELTDEEIEEFEHLIAKAFDFSTQIKVVGLDRIIRAILRKAQNG